MSERETGGIRIEKGSVVLVLRDNGDGFEEGGIIFDIEPSGRIFINYGGVVSLLHDEDQIRLAPENIREPLKLRLEQNQKVLTEEVDQKTSHIREALERYHESYWHHEWTKIKKFFGIEK